MSNLLDFMGGGGGIPHLDLSKSIPSIDLTPSVDTSFNLQKGDKSCILLNNGTMRRYNNSGSEVWSKTAYNTLTDYNSFMGVGIYVPATDTYHVVLTDGGTDDMVYAQMDTTDGSTTVGTPIASPGGTNPGVNAIDNFYSLSGTTLLFFGGGGNPAFVLSINTTTGAITNVTSTNQIPSDKTIFQGIGGGSPDNQYTILEKDSTNLAKANLGFTASFPQGESPAQAYRAFGDYIIPVGSSNVTSSSIGYAYKKTEFYTAVNALLLSQGVIETVWEV